MNDIKLSLDGNWLLIWDQSGTKTLPTTLTGMKTCGLPCIEGHVPGNFELDLERAGILPEIFFGSNVLKVQEYERSNVVYGREFFWDYPVTGREELLLEGADTYIRYYLNGVLIGETDNALIDHRLPMTGLMTGRNELVCVIRSCLTEAEKYPMTPMTTALAYNYESLHVRKAPSAYGWDIMPRTVSCGLWRDVSIVLRPEERISDAFLFTCSLSDCEAKLRLWFDTTLKDANGCYLLLTGTSGENTFEQVIPLKWRTGNSTFSVKEPKLWWPRGYGEPSLYNCVLTLYRGDTKLDEKHFRTGIRTVSLSRTSMTDAEGNGDFCFVINGRRVFLLGTNWVPADAFHSRDRERIPDILKLAWESGVNCLRCWGGNVYEDDTFFDICDEKGLVVWQDFSMACGQYPQDAAFAESLRREAVSVVRKLRQHCSLILWSGDNECDAAYFWTDPPTDPNLNILTRRVLPEVLFSEDPSRPFLPSSPYLDEACVSGNGRDLASENHIWGPRDYYKSPFYLSAVCHFASEIGYHGCPHPASIRKFISEDSLWPWKNNSEWLIHAASPEINWNGPYAYRIGLMADQAELLSGPDAETDLNSFALASQFSQAEAMKFFIERFRSQRGRRNGIIWWNIMDGWPQFSDAVVDYYGAKKLAFYAIAASSRPFQLMIDEDLRLLALNDATESQSLSYTVTDLFTGDILLSGSGVAEADSVTVLGQIPARTQALCHITFTTGSENGSNHYLMGKPPFSLNEIRKAMPVLFPEYHLEV